MSIRTIIFSEYMAKDKAHFSLHYDFCRIIMECDKARLIAPGIKRYLGTLVDRFSSPEADKEQIQRDMNRLVNGVRKSLGFQIMPTVTPATIEDEYQLFIFIAFDLGSLAELSRISKWRQKCQKAVIYIEELWVSSFARNRSSLDILDQFDHIFTAHHASIDELRQNTSTPCSFLPVGADCLIATPYPSPPDRVIDVYSIGRRSEPLHRELVSLLERREIYYVYDSLSSSESRVKSWHDHRLLISNNIKRSRYFIAFSPHSIATTNKHLVGEEQVLTARLFEGAAGGAVMIGKPPNCAEYEENFDWPDAIIEAPENPVDIRDMLSQLDHQAERLEALRRTSAVECLKRHDWCYRWERILETVGLSPTEGLHQRKLQLYNLAQAAKEADLSLVPH